MSSQISDEKIQEVTIQPDMPEHVPTMPVSLPENAVLSGQYIVDGVPVTSPEGWQYPVHQYSTGQKLRITEFIPQNMNVIREGLSLMPADPADHEAFENSKRSFINADDTGICFLENNTVYCVELIENDQPVIGTAFRKSDDDDGHTVILMGDMALKTEMEHPERVQEEDELQKTKKSPVGIVIAAVVLILAAVGIFAILM